jgi:hypothetical protein
MRQYPFAQLAAAALLVVASASASADEASVNAPFGHETDYVVNPAGRQVPQTHAGVGSAFGFSADSVPSGFERKVPRAASGADPSPAASSSTPKQGSTPLQKPAPWNGYSDPRFGQQLGD